MLDKDKQGHFIAGSAVFIAAFILFGVSSYALLWVAIAGAGKEIIHDYFMNKGFLDFFDFIATVSGGLLILIILGLF